MNVSRSLIQVRLGRLSELSSRAESMICRYSPSILVAIVVDGHEVVVRADLLELSEGVQKRLVVPKRHVSERGAVEVDLGSSEESVAFELTLFHLVERERRARRGDVVGDEGRLADLLVRRDHEPLHDRGVERSSYPDGEIESERRGHQPKAAQERLRGGEKGAQDRYGDERSQRRNPSVRVDVRGALENTGRRGQEVGHVEPGAEGQHDEQDRGESGEMTDGRGVREDPASRVESDVAREDLCRGDGSDGKDGETEGDLIEELQERKAKNEEADVPTEDGVSFSKGRPVREE